MTRDDIVRMAKEAGIEQVMRLHGGGSVVLPTPILERFAALVRAEVLEEAAREAELLAEKDRPGAAMCRTVLTAAAVRALK